jgi:hypothetical protein
MMVAPRTNVLRVVQVTMKDHFSATGTFAPQIFGRACPPHQTFDARTDKIGDPIHKANSSMIASPNTSKTMKNH